MDVLAFENLDLACARAGKDIAADASEELEKLITSALSVLEEQGPYTLFLFLKSHTKDIARNVSQKLFDFLKENPKQGPLLSGDGEILLVLQKKLAQDLDKLLLARDLLRQILIYARYHARLREDQS